MKLLSLCLVLFLSSLASAADKPAHLFILSGQSNMAGMNPNFGFEPEAAALFPNGDVAYIKVAVGGKPIRHWLSCWLTSSAPQETLDGGFPTNITLDQLLAREPGRETVLPSLELSCNDFADNKETKYLESISWYGPG